MINAFAGMEMMKASINVLKGINLFNKLGTNNEKTIQ